MINYEPFWKTIKEKDMTQYALMHNKVINPSTMQRIRKGKSITMTTLQKICFALDCTPNDVVMFDKDESEK